MNGDLRVDGMADGKRREVNLRLLGYRDGDGKTTKVQTPTGECVEMIPAESDVGMTTAPIRLRVDQGEGVKEWPSIAHVKHKAASEDLSQRSDLELDGGEVAEVGKSGKVGREASGVGMEG